MEYLLLVGGFVLLIKGADFFVEGSASVAKKLRVSSMVIGLTVVAMGTSAPECAVSIAASFRGDNAVAVSNVIGSNIFNLMIVCGVCSVISPLHVKAESLKKEFPLSILAAIALVAMGYLGMKIERTDGLILLAAFAAFIIWLVRSAKKERNAQEDVEEIKTLGTMRCLLYRGRRCDNDCRAFWTQPDVDWAYDCSDGNFPAGTGYLDCGGAQGRDGYGDRQRDWLQSF